MNCPNCGAVVENGTNCPVCGAPLAAPAPVPAPVDEKEAFLARNPEYKPLSAWAYFGLTILYSLPIIGFIFLLIFTFNKNNLNRRSFTRSYWIYLLIAVIAAIVLMCFGLNYEELITAIFG